MTSRSVTAVTSTAAAIGIVASLLTGTVGAGTAAAAPGGPGSPAVTTAEAVASNAGADVSYAVLDRRTGKVTRSANAGQPRVTASVVKVMIADQVLTLRDQGKLKLSSADLARLRLMITRSDDGAADEFWTKAGGKAIIPAVAARYHLTATVPPSDTWWDTMTSADDVVSFYNQVLSGTNTPPATRSFLIGAMRGFQATGTDGQNQTFGLPAVAPGGGYKQGWMELNDGSWVHNTTGFFGPGDRYVAAIFDTQPKAAEPESAAALTAVTKALLPGGAPRP